MKLTVAKIGKSVGLRGDLKLHLDTDFPEQFTAGAKFETKIGLLEIETYDPSRDLVKFKTFNSKEEAKKLTNLELYSTEESTKENIHLEDGEFFWFDIVECEVYEGKTLIGKVVEIERFTDIDYLKISLEESLAKEKKQTRVLVPYNDKYIVETDIMSKKIVGQNIFLLLDA